MNPDDYAIVVGISRYPGLAASPTDNANLNAPVRDANDVVEWLVSPRGGRLPRENIELICSDENEATLVDVLDAVPKLQQIQDAFHKLVLKAQESDDAGTGFRAGRRLYIYMSGHGFAPRTHEGALFVANATSLNVPNVYASGWLQWFQDAACFDEFVLWMDCCMDRLVTVDPEAISLRPRIAPPAPEAPTMIAFAATRNLRAIETSIDGVTHSVFTYTLLQGLYGAAADKVTGHVTGSSLGAYLANAMKDWIPAEEMKKTSTSKEPSIVKADPDLILRPAQQNAPLAPAPTYPVTMRFRDVPYPEFATLWQGSPPAAERLAVVDGVAGAVCPAGLYVLEVAEQGLRKGFEVTGTGPVDVDIGSSDKGPPVGAPPQGGLCKLDITLSEPAEIFVIDADFKLAARSQGGLLNKETAFGIYKIKTRLGRSLGEKIIFLDSDAPVRLNESPLVGTPILQAKDGASLEPTPPGADSPFARIHVHVGDGAEVLLMIRDDPSLATGPGGAPVPGVPTSYDIRLLDSGKRVLADLNIHGVRQRQGAQIDGQPTRQSFACCRVALAPGAYFLQRTLAGGAIQEQTILAVEGFRTELHELRRRRPLGDGQDFSNEQVMLMCDLDAPFSDKEAKHDATLIQAATVALADHRKVLEGTLRERLITSFRDPIAGLLGGHLLLIENEGDQQFDPAAGLPELDDLVRRLRALVKGEQPDIEALSQRCADRSLRGTAPLSYPPVFSRSWKIAVEASRENEQLVPADLWSQVHAKLSCTPYFAWASDARSREAHAKGLVSQVREAVDAPSEAAELALRAVPAQPVAAMPPSRAFDPVRTPAKPVPAAQDVAAPPVPDRTAKTAELVPRLARQWSIPSAALGRLLEQENLGPRAGVGRQPP